MRYPSGQSATLARVRPPSSEGGSLEPRRQCLGRADVTSRFHSGIRLPARGWGHALARLTMDPDEAIRVLTRGQDVAFAVVDRAPDEIRGVTMRG
jgi:hypothetical protein